jgi:hypothetical protein
VSARPDMGAISRARSELHGPRRRVFQDPTIQKKESAPSHFKGRSTNQTDRQGLLDYERVNASQFDKPRQKQRYSTICCWSPASWWISSCTLGHTTSRVAHWSITAKKSATTLLPKEAPELPWRTADIAFER